MRKFITRLTALLLASITVSSMIACSDNSAAETDTAAVTDSISTETTAAAETDYLDTLDEADFNGRTFTIIAQNTADRQNFYMEEKDGDLINDAIHERDMAVEERLNIKYEFVQNENRSEVTNMVQRTLQAGDEAYNMIINSLSAGIHSLTTGGFLLDLNELPYVTLDGLWWNKSMSEKMLFNGKQYFTTGAVSGVYYLTPISLMYNKKLVEDYGLGNIYEIVLDGKWTIDKLAELTLDKSRDLNNDGKMDVNDFWGLITDSTFGGALYVGAGCTSVTNVNGEYTITVDSEESVNVIEKCAALFGNRQAVLNDDTKSKTYEKDIFGEDRGLFISLVINTMLDARSMESDFGIVPCPKLTEEQDQYYTTCNTWWPSGVGVPMICSDLDYAGLVMETMAYKSYEIIQPAVYETTLQGKLARDDESVQMLDIIYENAAFDLLTVFDFGGASILLRRSVMGEQQNFMSAYASIKDAAHTALDNVMKFSE